MASYRSVVFVVALVAALMVMLPGGPARPITAGAEDCTPDGTGTLVIEIYDRATDSLLTFGGADVLVDPDPRDFELDHVVVDSDAADANAAEDQDSDPGVIRIEACSTEGGESYTATLFSLPGVFDDCATVVNSDSGSLSEDGTTTLNLEVDCSGVLPTPTVAPTATPGPPSSVSAGASPLSLGCNGTSIVTIQVRDAGGKAVQPGTPVTVTTTLGSLSPASGHATDSQGNLTVFFTAPAASGGAATITASSGSASGTTMVNVTCSAAAVATGTSPAVLTQVTPTVSTSGVITPPNTGDAGLASSSSSLVLPVVVMAAVASLGLSRGLMLRRKAG